MNPAFCGEASVGRSLAAGDLDNDGAIDLVLANVGGPVRLYRNIRPNRGHWLKLRLINPQHGGRDAIGAEVRFRADGRQHWNVLQPATSYLASNEPALHFGLGNISNISDVEVLWPEGERELFKIGGVNRLVQLRKGEGTRR